MNNKVKCTTLEHIGYSEVTIVAKTRKKKEEPPVTYHVSYWDGTRNIPVEEMTSEEHEQARKALLLNMANAYLRPFGARAYIADD